MSEREIGLALEMKHVSKRFPGTIAVDDVSFEVYAGEVHALVGENGAGKSTLMKMLAGSFDDYTGEICINGRDVTLHTPTEAKKYGIGMIYQELSLARPISITENLLAGRLPRKGPSSWTRPRARAQAEGAPRARGTRPGPRSSHRGHQPARGSARRDRESARERPSHPRHGRADERPLPRRGRAPLRDHSPAQEPRHRDRLHLPPSPGDIPDRGPRYGHAGRQEDRDQADKRGQPRGDRPDDGRTISEGILQAGRAQDRRGQVQGRRAFPASVSSTISTSRRVGARPWGSAGYPGQAEASWPRSSRAWTPPTKGGSSSTAPR